MTVTALRDPERIVDGYWFMLGEIRAELARRHVSQAELAPMLGLAQPHLSGRLSGRIPWRYSELMRLAAVLGLSMADLALWSEGPDGADSVSSDYVFGAALPRLRMVA